MVKTILAIVRFVIKLLLFAVIIGMITMLSDYLWASYFNFPLHRRGPLERVARYSAFSLVAMVISGSFLLFILSDFIRRKWKRSVVLNMVVLLVAGLAIGIITQGDGWEFYLGPGRRPKHILIVGLSFALYPVFSHCFYRLFNKRKP